MSLENNISKIMIREKEIENILVNSSNLKPSELANLSKELSDIKSITDLANKKENLVKEVLDLSEIISDKSADAEIKEIATNEFNSLKEKIIDLEKEIQFALLPKDKDDKRPPSDIPESDRDNFLDASAAMTYGIVDSILEQRD